MHINLNFTSSVANVYPSSFINKVGNWIRKVSPLQAGIAIGVTAFVAVLAVILFCRIQKALSKSKPGNSSQDSKGINAKPLPEVIPSPLKATIKDKQAERNSPSPVNSDSHRATSSPKSELRDKKDSKDRPASPHADKSRSPDRKLEERTSKDEPSTQPIDNPQPQVQKVPRPLISESLSPKKIENFINELISFDKRIQELKIVLPACEFGKRTIKEDIFEIIAEKYPNLENLSLCASQEEPFPIHLSKGFHSLSKLRKLKSLQMVQLSAENLAIGSNKSLETLHIESCTFSQYPKEINTLEKLHTLSLTQNLFDKKLDTKSLAQEYSNLFAGLKENLVNIELQDFRLRILPAAFVGEAFKEFVKLKKLDLQKNPLIDKPDFSSKQVNQTILLDEDYSSPKKALTGKNVMIIGRSRSGKSTLMEVLANNLYSKKPTIFSETKGSSFKTIKIPDLLIDGKSAQINVHDTPGLFEVLPAETEPRSNKDILNTICKDSNNFVGQKSLENIDHVFLTFSPNMGINQHDLDSIMISFPYLYRMGLPTTTKIHFVLTSVESKSESQLKKYLKELNQHPVTSKIISDYKVGVLFSGAIGYWSKPAAQANEKINVIFHRETILSELFDTSLQDINSEVTHEIKGDIYS